jgi:hypothetical protein
MVARFEAIEKDRMVEMLGRLETVGMLEMLETIETLERFRMVEMLGRLEILGILDMLETIEMLEMLEMLGELLSIYDNSGCCDWPMDAMPVELSQTATRTRTVPSGWSPCASSDCRQPTWHGGSVLVVESRQRL